MPRRRGEEGRGEEERRQRWTPMAICGHHVVPSAAGGWSASESTIKYQCLGVDPIVRQSRDSSLIWVIYRFIHSKGMYLIGMLERGSYFRCP